MKLRPLLSVIVVMLVLTPIATAQDVAKPDFDKAVTQVIDGTNAFRRENKLDTVKRNDELMKTAQAFADFMARTDKYGHEADGSTPSKRAERNGYDYCLVSENIAWQMDSRGFTTDALSNKLVTGWQNSPPHRKNMLMPEVTETGVGIAYSEKSQKYYGVQMFGRPKSLSITFTIENRSNSAFSYKLGERSVKVPALATVTQEICLPETLQLDWPTAQPDTSLEPQDGDRFVVTLGGDGKFTVRSGRRKSG